MVVVAANSLLSLTDWRTQFVSVRGIKGISPGITDSIQVRGTPKFSEEDMSPPSPRQIPPWL